MMSDFFVTTQKVLDEKMALIKNAAFVAIDTEFMREKTYFPKLCLIQISDGKTHFIIDALCGGLDLSVVKKLLLNKKITKVIHSSRQDMEVLFNTFGKLPQNIFDSQIAMQFLGFKDSPSYDTIIQHYLHIKVDKKFQYSDWQKRPLQLEQLEYALSDVIYLAQVYPLIYADLEKLNRLSWLHEECAKIEKFKSFIADDLDLLLKVANFLNTEEELLKALRLIRAREEIAIKRDLGRGRVMRDEVLIKFAKGYLNESDFKIANNTQTKKAFAQYDAQKDEEAIVKAAMKKKVLRPKNKDDNFQKLRAHILKISEDQSISASLIANTEDIRAYLSGSKKARLCNGWRRELLNLEAV